MHCSNCGYDGEFTDGICPICRTNTPISKEEINELKKDLEKFLKEKEYENAIEHYKLLSSLGDPECECGYARILEEGVLVPQDLDKAISLYKSAAFKNNATGAYKYSRYIIKKSVNKGLFWLIYSGVLGEADAYPQVARELSSLGRELEANYFYTLASHCDHKKSTLILAQRYYEGIGLPAPNEAAAKWYLKKYKILPPTAVPLALKLRKVKAREPQIIEFNEKQFLRMLVKLSRELGYDVATLNLCEMLGSKGELEALTAAAMMKIKNIGVQGRGDEGLKTLRECAIRGSSDAYITLGDLYKDGEFVKKDINAAIFNYEMAAKAGKAEAYEILGDIYTSGEDMPRDFVKALGYYEKAKELDSEKGRKRAEEIISEREKFFNNARLELDDQRRYKLFAISAAMGHCGAMLSLGECYEKGIGVKPDRVSAYNFYLEAAENGEVDAFLPLGRCYLDGIGINRNFSLALDILKRAEGLGDLRAREYIRYVNENKKRKLAKRVYSQAMELVHMKKPDIAVELLALAEKLEYPKAIYSLGCLYEFGMGVPIDKDKAYAMYEKAYSMLFRDPRAKFKLSILRKARELF